MTAPSRHSSHPNRRMNISTVVFSDQRDSMETTWQCGGMGEGGREGGRGREGEREREREREREKRRNREGRIHSWVATKQAMSLYISNFDNEHSPPLPDHEFIAPEL